MPSVIDITIITIIVIIAVILLLPPKYDPAIRLKEWAERKR